LTESQNEKLALKIVEAYNSKDVDAFLDLYADDVDVVFPDLATPNKEEMRMEFMEIIEAVPDRRFEVVLVLSTDKGAVVECVVKGTNTGPLFGMPPTNRSIEMPMVHIYDFVDGKVKRQRTYANYQIMMQQLSSE